MRQLEDRHLAKATYFLSVWKGYHTLEQIEAFALRLTAHPEFDAHACLLAVPFPYLAHLADKLHSSQILLGCNAMLSTKPTSFTESIAGKILPMNQAAFVLIGTAESRHTDNLTNKDCHLAIKKALQANLTPFYCVGETVHELEQGASAAVLTAQCREALEGLAPAQLARVVMVYEAPWLQSVAEKPTYSQLQEKYATFRRAVLDAIGEQAFSKIRLINALPLELAEPAAWAQLEGRGFLAKKNLDDFISLLEAKSLLPQTPFEWEPEEAMLEAERGEAGEVSPSLPPSIQTSKEASMASQPASLAAATEKLELEAPQLPPTQATYLPAAVEAEAHGLTCEKLEKELLLPEEANLEPAIRPEAELQMASTEAEETAPAAIEAHEASLAPEFQALAEGAPEPLLEEAAEEAFELEANENIPQISEAELQALIAAKQNKPIDELQELQSKVETLSALDRSLAECYHEMQEKIDLLPKLKTQFPEKLSQMTADLNQLDPLLQEQINRGNIAFFTENPDKMKEASKVLRQIQEINQLLQMTAAIPRDVDRLSSKSRELRKKLDAEWRYFASNRQQIKEKHPDFNFPHPPSQLQVKEPALSLAPPDMGPSSLTSKRFAVVKSPPSPK